MRRWESLFWKLLRLELVLVVVLVVLELGCRAWIASAGEETFRRYASWNQLQERYADQTQFRIQPHRYLGMRLMPGYESGPNRHNSHGFRGAEIADPKPPGEFRIVCIGGSTTYGTEIADDAKAYPAQLEAKLRAAGHDEVRVINAGCGHWSTWESLVNLELFLVPLEPDLIVVYHAINDVHARLVWPPEAYRGDNTGHRPPITGEQFVTPWWHSFAAARVLGVSLGWMEPHSHLLIQRKLFDEFAETSYAGEFDTQMRAGTYPSGLFEEVPAQRMLDENPPTYFERNLRSLVGVAKGAGIDTVLATFAWSPEFPGHPRVTSDEYQGALAEMNDVVRAVAVATDAHLFDFQPLFTEARWFTDGRHTNPEGAARKAELFARFLLDAGLVGD